MYQKRRNDILDIIKHKSELQLNELMESFPNVSEMTLRRDLYSLEKEGFITRIRGGAKLNEDDYSLRSTANVELKNDIAKCALRFLEENRSIYIDAGSTLMQLAKKVPNTHLYIITSAPNIAMEIIQRKNTEVILLGGLLGKKSVSVSGQPALLLLETLNIDTAFMGTTGFSLENGFSIPYQTECELKKKVIATAKKVNVLMDHTKINKNLPFTFAMLEDINCIITDRQMPENILEEAVRKNVEIVY